MPDIFPFYACFGGFLCLVVPFGLVRLTFCAARDRFAADEAQFLTSDLEPTHAARTAGR